jgi:DNA-binding NarL/FixJ family response regulator
VIVDDHQLVRYGVGRLVASEGDLEVCGEAANPDQAIDVIRRTRPAVVIVDLSLENGSGLDLIKRIREEDSSIRVLVLSMHDERLHAERALRAGAQGYVNKQWPAEELLVAVRRVRDRHIYLSEQMTDALLGQVAGGGSESSPPIERLSDREFEIFRMIGSGRSVRQIAGALNISPKTVEYHRTHVKQKLNLSTSVELSRYAIEWTFENE